MNPLENVKKNGVKHTLDIIYKYEIDIILTRILGLFLRNKPLQDIIVIESHNDFDSNGGAFYNYLIKNEYNKKYKIVWAIKHPKTVPQKLPENVDWYAIYKPSIKKNYYKWIATYFTSDNDCSAKLRSDQKVIYFGHGGFGLKNWKGYIKLPEKIDYVAMPSKYLKDVFADQMMLASNDPRLCYIGFPYVDNFYDGKEGDLHKITANIYRKVILWMPTFRKGTSYKRQDSRTIGALGIPLIYNMDDYYKLNGFLKENNALLILKIHPMQDIRDLKIKSTSNICVLTGNDVKKLKVDNYHLMKDCDALISDYSSAAYDFLQCNKPIAYDFSDVQDYKLGLSVENPEDYMAGHYIKSKDDMISFINDVLNDIDRYYEKRQVLRKKIFDYYDGNNSQRAIELLGI